MQPVRPRWQHSRVALDAFPKRRVIQHVHAAEAHPCSSKSRTTTPRTVGERAQRRERESEIEFFENKIPKYQPTRFILAHNKTTDEIKHATYGYIDGEGCTCSYLRLLAFEGFHTPRNSCLLMDIIPDDQSRGLLKVPTKTFCEAQMGKRTGYAQVLIWVAPSVMSILANKPTSNNTC